MEIVICMRCGEPWVSEPPFLTCCKCRIPDTAKRTRKAKRFKSNDHDRYQKLDRWAESGSSFDNVVRASEDQ